MKRLLLLVFALPLILLGCKVSYSFNGASIDYNETKTLEIRDFSNQAPLAPIKLFPVFNDHIKDVFTRNTKLQLTDTNPDLEIEGEVTRYDLTPLSVKENSFASQTRLTMAVRMRFRNNKNPQKDKEETISAYRDFDSNNMLSDVDDTLIDELTKEIVDQIFNATMSDW